MSQVIVDRVRKSIQDRNEVIQELYHNNTHKKAVIGTLIKNGCAKEHAEDYFVDSIVNFVKACYRSDFEIKSSLTNYLIGTAKNIWLRQVTNQQKQRTIKQDIGRQKEESYEIQLLGQSKSTLLSKLIEQLDDTCRQLLTLWAANHKMQEIADSLNYKSAGMARKKKHQCMQRLYAIVDSNPVVTNELRSLL